MNHSNLTCEVYVKTFASSLIARSYNVWSPTRVNYKTFETPKTYEEELNVSEDTQLQRRFSWHCFLPYREQMIAFRYKSS
jgi:hypothetical protein